MDAAVGVQAGVLLGVGDMRGVVLLGLQLHLPAPLGLVAVTAAHSVDQNLTPRIDQPSGAAVDLTAENGLLRDINLSLTTAHVSGSGALADLPLTIQARGAAPAGRWRVELTSRLQADGMIWIGLIASSNSAPFYRRLGFRSPAGTKAMMLSVLGNTNV